MVKPYVLISLNTSIDTTDWALGAEFLASLINSNIKLAPEKISNREEKIDRVFNCIADAESIWAPTAKMLFEGDESTFPLNFCWKRKSAIKSEGVIVHTQMLKSGTVLPGRLKVKISCSNRRVDYMSLFETWIELFKPWFGMLHLFSGDELLRAPFGSPESIFRLGPSSKILLDKGVPDLAWCSFFGDRYNGEIDKGALAKQGVNVKECFDGVLLNLTDELSDVADKGDVYKLRKERCKEGFSSGFFMKDECLF